MPPSRTPGISPTAIAGKEMTRINPLTGAATTEETQTGTWFENQLEKRLRSQVEEQTEDRADSEGEPPRRKFMRREASLDQGFNIAAQSAGSPNETVADPPIDQYTHLLGIGWTYVGEGSDRAAMARGYSRYIENYYPLTNVETLLSSKSLESYLVKTSQGYYLFKEDLLSGQLVATTWEDTLVNLQWSPVRFSGAQVLLAAKTPTIGLETATGEGSSAMATEEGDMDMD